jgi:hypothetical protein
LSTVTVFRVAKSTAKPSTIQANTHLSPNLQIGQPEQVSDGSVPMRAFNDAAKAR